MSIVFPNVSRLSCSFIIGLALLGSTAFAQDRILVKNEPPLTQEMVDRVIDFFEWSLGVRLSPAQKAELQKSTVESWKRNDKATINGTLEVLQLYSRLSALSDAQLSQVRGEIRDEVLKGLRQGPRDKVSDILLSLYEASLHPGPDQPNRSNTDGRSEIPPASVNAGAGDLYGIYIAVTKQLIAPGPGSPVQQGITWTPTRDWMTFVPGGHFFARLPEEGLAGFNYAEAVRKNPEAKGTYKVEGNLVRIAWAGGGGKTLRRSADGDLWEDRTNWTPLPRCNGLRLNGKYSVLWNEYSARNFIRFSRDGRFEESGLLQQIGWKRTEVRQGTGTYSIRENTLELRYADGRIERINFYAFPEELKKPNPEVVYINSFDFRSTQ